MIPKQPRDLLFVSIIDPAVFGVEQQTASVVLKDTVTDKVKAVVTLLEHCIADTGARHFSLEEIQLNTVVQIRKRLS